MDVRTKHRFRATAVALAAATIATGFASVAVYAADGAPRSMPPEKQALLDAERSRMGTPPTAKPVPPPTTVNSPCPTPVGTGQIGPFAGGPFGQTQLFTTQTSFTGSDGYPYQVYAGADAEDPLQGVLVVWRMAKDPCNTDNYDGDLVSVKDASHSGVLTLVSVQGDNILYRSPSGLPTSINVVVADPRTKAGG